ncbi:MAG: hypothetical protein KatS3mg103_0838 [Phycisphaerales bacterium]|nr:MAG: hypothetical protein KatS3mg103_0838 [Phycisphaerales bacterium]
MNAVATMVLAWRPFLDPIDAHRWWFLLILPVAVLVSLSWKAVRIEDLRRLPRAVAVMTVQVVLAMLGLGLAAYVGLVVVLPILAGLVR